MKNMMKYFLLVAVAAMGFACSEDQSDSTVSIPEVEMVEMTVLADADSRTIYDEAAGKAQWESTGEYIQVWETIDGSEEPASKKSSQGVVDTEGKAAFKVSFTKNDAGTEYAYHAVYPASAVVTDNNLTVEKLKLITPAVQNATATSFDGAADLLISQPKILEAQPTELSLAFARVVAIGKMTLKNIDTEENILSVSFSSEGKVFAGRSYFNANTAEVAKDNGKDGYGYNSPSAELTINYAGGLANVKAGTPIYFTSLPTEIKGGESFTVTVSTASKKFTRKVTLPEGNSIAFNAGRVSTFGVNMASATVEEISSLEGDYAVMAKNSSNEILLMGNQTSTYLTSNKDATLSDIPEQYEYLDESLVWTVVAGENEGQYYLQQKSSGKYVSWSSGNAATLETTAYALTIEKQENGTYEVLSVKDATRKLQYNASNPRFAFYSGAQTAICLVPATPNTAPTLRVVAQPAMVAAEGAEVEVELFTANLTDEVEADCEENWISGLTVADNKLTFTVGENTSEEERTATITLSANGVEATVEVSQLGAAAAGETMWVKVTSVGEITEGEYILASVYSSSTYGYLPNTAATNAGPTIVASDLVKLDEIADSQVTDAMKWTFVAATGGYKITSSAKSSNLLYTNSGTGNNIRISNGTSRNVWTITADNSYTWKISNGTHRLAVYNATQWRNYAATSTTNQNGKFIIFKKVESGGGDEPEWPAEPVQLAAPENVTATASGNIVTVTWDEVANAESYTITCGGKTEDGVEGTSVEFEMDYDESYTVTVVAKGDGTNYTDSPAVTKTVTTEADPNAGGGDEPGEEKTYSVTDFLTELGLSGTTTLTADTKYALGDDITLSVNKGTGSNVPAVNKDNTLRIYTNTKMTLASEYTIVKVVFTFSSTTNATINTVDTGNYNATTYTWTGSAKSVTFSTTSSTQTRIKTIEITYK